MGIDTDIPSGSVVVGVDGSESARRAATWAAELAHRDRRVLGLVHAVEAPVLPYQGYGWVTVDATRWRRELAVWATKELRDTGTAVTRDRSGLDVRRVVVEGDARSALAEAARHAAVLVVGTHGHGRVARVVLGSVSDYLARHAECPVVVVRETFGDGPVVAAVDDPDSGAPVLEHAFHQASVWGRALRVVHADAPTPPPSTGDDALRKARLRLAASIADLREKYPDVVATTDVLGSGDPGSALLEESREAFLLVLGRRSRSGFRALMSPPVVTALLEHALCPVAVVPSGSGPR